MGGTPTGVPPTGSGARYEQSRSPIVDWTSETNV